MKKITSLVVSAILLLTLVMSLVACGSSSSSSGTTDQKTYTVVGKVTAVDGNNVTIDTSSQKDSSESGESGEDTPPAKPEGEGEGNSNGDTQAAPPDDSIAEFSEAGQSATSKDNSDISNASNTITITITDTSVLYKKENGTEVQATLADIKVGVTLTITYNGSSTITKIVISGNGGGGGGGEVIYDAANKITSATSETGKTYASDSADEIALLIDTSEEVTITNPTLTKSGDSAGGDNCNFYGQNAGLLVKGGSTTNISGGTVTTKATGANGVFSYGGNSGQNEAAGDGTTVNISGTTITTTGDGSGGIMTTGGGTTKASNLKITTNGQSSAPIRSDKGGGTVVVEGGSYTSNGLGSPAIYSTANITVSDATLISNLSEGVCIEGKNTVTLIDSSLTATNTKCNGNATFLDTIMLYQSMSGDASTGTATFTMSGGKLVSKKGHVFHITNTDAVISLDDVDITNADSEDVLLSVCDDGWTSGTSTKNIATLNASEQTLNGAILVGDNSKLTMELAENSSFEGYVNGNIKNAKGDVVSSEVGTVAVTLDATSTWTLTADSYITSFNGNASNVIANGHKLYVNGVPLEGTK